MFRLAAMSGLLGLIAATAVIIWSGYAQVLQALSVAGWGILWTSLFHVIPMLASVTGWHALLSGRKRPSVFYILYIQWLRSSVNNLLPVARIGGEIVSVRVMIKHGMLKTTAVASTIVELTTSVLAVFVFDVIGIGLFIMHVGNHDMGLKLVGGLLLALPPLVAMVAVQRVGFFGLLDKVFTFIIRDKWKKMAGGLGDLDRAVYAMYRRYSRVLICFFWQLVAWFLGTFEIWLALHYLGHTFSLGKSFMIEALIQASASAAFVVPGALGVQEAGFLVFGQMLGLAPDIAVALAVIRRCRDLILYVPGLITWQIQEGKWLLKRRKSL